MAAAAGRLTDLGSVERMRAVVYSQLGDSSVLELVERDLPDAPLGRGPGPARGGRGQPHRLEVPGRCHRRRRCRSTRSSPGQDGAGIVDEVGNGVFDVKVGDRVWVFLAQHDRPLGTATEYTVVPADRVVRLGDASYDVGASLGVPAMTAHRALTVHEDGPDRLSPGRARRSHRAGHRRRGRGRPRRDPARASGPAPPWSPRSAATRRPPWPRPRARTTSSTTATATPSPRSRRSRPTASTSSSTSRSSQNADLVAAGAQDPRRRRGRTPTPAATR